MVSQTAQNPIITGTETSVPKSVPTTNPNPALVQNAQVVTNTTTVDRTVGNVLVGVSVIPYMRYLAVDFLGYRLRPNRQVWFYFDDKPVDAFVQRPNIIEVNTTQKVKDMREGAQKTLRIGTSTARILHVEKDVASGNAKFYVSEFDGPTTFAPGTTVTVDNSTFSDTLKTYEHFSGFVQSGTTNTAIVFSNDAITTNEYYTGNTVCIVNGTNAGQSVEIVSYDGATRTATIDPPLKINSKDDELIYTIGDAKNWYVGSEVPTSYVTPRGLVSGIFHIPDPNKNDVQFRTGDRIFRILDNPRNDVSSYTTRADYRFTSNGLDKSVAQIIERNAVTEIVIIPPVTPSPTPTRSRTPQASLTPTPSVSSTPDATPTVTPTVTPTKTQTVTPTVTPTITPTRSPTESPDAPPVPSVTPTVTPTPEVSGTPDPTPTPTRSATLTKTPTPTRTVTITPTKTPTKTVTPTPSAISSDPCARNTETISDTLSWTKGPNKQKSLSEMYSGLVTGQIMGFNIQRIAYCDSSGKVIKGSPNTQSAPLTHDIIVPVYGQDCGSPIGCTKVLKTNKSSGYHVPGNISIPAGTKFPSGTYIAAWTAADGKYGNAINVSGLNFWQVMYDMSRSSGQCVTIPHDPVAQTFYVPVNDYPDGVFVSSVDLFFRNRGESLPIEVQIRPVVNGVPSSNTVIPGATTTLDNDEILVSNFPSISDVTTNTRFTFPSPVYLNSGYEYAVVVITDDYGYDFYGTALGEKIIGTDTVVSKQPFMGSMFKSQNQMTWTPLQDEDMMFVLNKASFVDEGTIIFEENKTAMRRELRSNVKYNSFDSLKANTYYDAFELRSDSIELKNTKIDYYYKGVPNSTLVMSSAYTNFKPEQRIDLKNRNILFNPQLENKSTLVRMDLSTKNPHVSPIVYQNMQNMITIENLINNTGLTADRFNIVDGGSGYDGTNAYLTITSNVGYGANAWAVTNTQTGQISSIVVNSPGVGYVDDVTVTVGGGSGSGAIVNVSTETGTSGGPAIARYISKTVTLLDGFDAGDLRVFMTAVKPPGANVNVYYKVRNSLDPDRIENRNWVRMEQKTSQYTFSTNRTPIEYEYRPSMTSNNITYTTDTTTYKTFNQFAIKIVLSANNTVASSIPYVLDVRAIALPEDAY